MSPTRLAPFAVSALVSATVAAAQVPASSQTAPSPAPAAAQAVERKATLPGVRNYTRVDATVGCAGAVTPESVAAIKAEGYAAILNLRLATETDANVEGERRAADRAGLKFLHLPFDSSAPDPAVVKTFLKLAGDPNNQPLFIHCASANRVGALWLIKRVKLDRWSIERATEEATAIGLTNPQLKAFALNYLKS